MNSKYAVPEQISESQPSPRDISTLSWARIYTDYPGFNAGFHCPCSKSFGNAQSYFAHQDKCWAWGHCDCLVMRHNALGGCKAEGDRFIIPSSRKVKSNGNKHLVPSPPKCSTYTGNWMQHTEPLCGKAWLKKHGTTDIPEPNLEITFDANGATKQMTLTDLSELYPKMVKKFGGRIKIAT